MKKDGIENLYTEDILKTSVTLESSLHNKLAQIVGRTESSKNINLTKYYKGQEVVKSRYRLHPEGILHKGIYRLLQTNLILSEYYVANEVQLGYVKNCL